MDFILLSSLANAPLPLLGLGISFTKDRGTGVNIKVFGVDTLGSYSGWRLGVKEACVICLGLIGLGHWCFYLLG